MVHPDDLKTVVMLRYLNDSMLKKMVEITSMTEHRSGEYIFKEGDHAAHLYSIIDGKVGLELEKNSSARFLIDTITQGLTFGFSALVDTITQGLTFGFSALVDTKVKKYTTNAKALTDTKLFTWKGTDLQMLFQQDYEMGFLFMKRIAKIAKKRLQIRNVQFLDIYS
jgi:CRP-like cAMP-binding protein